MAEETVEQFLARGGRIRVLNPSDDRFASHVTKFHFGETGGIPSTAAVISAFKPKGSREMPWIKGRSPNELIKQYSRKVGG